MICNLIGQECLREECAQWKPKRETCVLDRYIGNFLYYGQAPIDLASFYKYLEEIRPRGLPR